MISFTNKTSDNIKDYCQEWLLYVIWHKCKGNNDFANKLNSLPLAHTTPWAVKEASKLLKIDKESTTESEEIDSIVPNI